MAASPLPHKVQTLPNHPQSYSPQPIPPITSMLLEVLPQLHYLPSSLQSRTIYTFILTTPHLHNYTLPVYALFPSLPLTVGTPYTITYKLTHQLPPLNATLRLITSPLPSLPLTVDCSSTNAVHKPTK